MIELDLSKEERKICTKALELSVQLFDEASGFKNISIWKETAKALKSDAFAGLEADSIRALISAFNIHYLLVTGQNEKVLSYIRKSLHSSEKPAKLMDYKNMPVCQSEEYPAAFETVRKKLTERLKEFLGAKKYLPRKLYISDLHFYHTNLNRFMDCRGFEDETAMNEYMIKQWNDHVNEHDEVYILGDFSVGRGKMTADILTRLKGKKYLITGNHDSFLDDREFDSSLFVWVKPYEKIKDRKRHVVLSHYPVFCYDGQYRTDKQEKPNTYMLYGHVHDSFDERLVNEFIKKTRASKRMIKHSKEPVSIPCNMINCFCMYSDYVPLTLDEWIALDEKRRKEIADV